jgi:hypothetical protein
MRRLPLGVAVEHIRMRLAHGSVAHRPTAATMPHRPGSCRVEAGERERERDATSSRPRRRGHVVEADERAALRESQDAIDEAYSGVQALLFLPSMCLEPPYLAAAILSELKPAQAARIVSTASPAATSGLLEKMIGTRIARLDAAVAVVKCLSVGTAAAVLSRVGVGYAAALVERLLPSEDSWKDHLESNSIWQEACESCPGAEDVQSSMRKQAAEPVMYYFGGILQCCDEYSCISVGKAATTMLLDTHIPSEHQQAILQAMRPTLHRPGPPSYCRVLSVQGYEAAGVYPTQGNPNGTSGEAAAERMRTVNRKYIHKVTHTRSFLRCGSLDCLTTPTRWGCRSLVIITIYGHMCYK